MRTDANTDQPHRDNFAALRAVAALLVLYAHQHALSGRAEPGFIGIHSYGGLGVMIFFAISGFLVAQSWQADPHPIRFAARRLLRIWPGFAVLILLTALVLGPCVSSLPWREYFRHPLLQEYLLNLRFQMRGAIPAQFEGNTIPGAINGSLWTIPLELQCYIALIVVGMAGLVARRHWLALCTAALMGCYAGWQLRGERIVSALALRIEQQYLIEFGLCFFVGVTLRLYWPNLRAHRAALVGGSALLALLAFRLGRPVLAGLIVVPVAAITFGTLSWRAVRQCDRWGDFSYGLYLYAFPVQQTLLWALGDQVSWWPLLTMTVLATLLCAYLSWHLIEKHALRLKPQRRLAALAGTQPAPMA